MLQFQRYAGTCIRTYMPCPGESSGELVGAQAFWRPANKVVVQLTIVDYFAWGSVRVVKHNHNVLTKCDGTTHHGTPISFSP